jgi:hypothetical protein
MYVLFGDRGHYGALDDENAERFLKHWQRDLSTISSKTTSSTKAPVIYNNHNVQ